MRIVAIRMQQADGDRFGAGERALEIPDLERALHCAIEQHALIHAEADIAGDERARRRGIRL